MATKQVPVVLGVIVNDKGEIFLTQRNDPDTNEHAKWEFPGGKVQFGETPENAVVREVKEETGFDVEIIRLLPKIYENTYPPSKSRPFHNFHVILLSYHCKIIGGQFRPRAVETLTGKYFEKDKIDYANCLAYTKEIIDLVDK